MTLQLGAGTVARVTPWVSRLPATTSRITARDGTPDDPILGEVLCRPTDRDGVVEELSELLTSACEASERPVAVTCIAWSPDDVALARLVVRVKPARTSEVLPSEPSSNLVQVLTAHAQVLTRVMVESQAGMMAGYRDTINMLSERLVSVESARSVAEVNAREATELADMAMAKAHAKPADTAQGRIMQLLEAAVSSAAPDVVKRMMGALVEPETKSETKSKPESDPDEPGGEVVT